MGRQNAFVQRLLLAELLGQLEAMVSQLARSLALLKRFAAGLWDGKELSTDNEGPLVMQIARRWAPFFVRADDLRNDLVSRGFDVQDASQVVKRSILKFQKAVAREIERREDSGTEGSARGQGPRTPAASPGPSARGARGQRATDVSPQRTGPPPGAARTRSSSQPAAPRQVGQAAQERSQVERSVSQPSSVSQPASARTSSRPSSAGPGARPSSAKSSRPSSAKSARLPTTVSDVEIDTGRSEGAPAKSRTKTPSASPAPSRSSSPVTRVRQFPARSVPASSPDVAAGGRFGPRPGGPVSPGPRPSSPGAVRAAAELRATGEPSSPRMRSPVNPSSARPGGVGSQPAPYVVAVSAPRSPAVAPGGPYVARPRAPVSAPTTAPARVVGVLRTR